MNKITENKGEKKTEGCNLHGHSPKKNKNEKPCMDASVRDTPKYQLPTLAFN